VVTDFERQAIIDEEHLRLLPIFYWALAGIDILISLYGLFYMGMGALLSSAPFPSSNGVSGPPPEFISTFFFGIGAAFLLGFGLSATLKIMTGFWLRKRKHRTACLVIAAIACLSIPFGTIAGIMTFIVLMRPSVAAMFGVRPASGMAVPPMIPEPPAADVPPQQ